MPLPHTSTVASPAKQRASGGDTWYSSEGADEGYCDGWSVGATGAGVGATGATDGRSDGELDGRSVGATGAGARETGAKDGRSDGK